jgi:hypothetical protein
MKRHSAIAARAVAPFIALATVLASATAPVRADTPTPFKLTNIHFETNSTACDMGIQMSFDTDGITEGEIENPFGQPVFIMQSLPGMEITGDITEVFQERVEPPISDLQQALGCEPTPDAIALTDLLAAWPAGWYQFDGESGDEEFEGRARLTHKIPAGPVITYPRDGDIVHHDAHLPISWRRVTTPILPYLGPVEVVGYHVLLVDITNPVLPPGKTKTSFDADLPRGETTFFVPKQFLEPGRIYELEVLATEKGGNQTITEGGVVCTPPITRAKCVKP